MDTKTQPQRPLLTLSAKARNALAVVAATALAAGPALAQTAPTTPEAGIGDALLKLLAIVAVGGAAMISLSLAGVGWRVGAKWIKSLVGKA